MRKATGDDPPAIPEGPAAACTAVDALRLQERALRVGRTWVGVAVLSDRAASFGVGVPSSDRLYRGAERAGLALVARGSGGAGLVHEPGDLLWGVVLPRDDPRVGRDFTRAYGRLGEGIVRMLARLGIASRWRPGPSTEASYCTLSGRGEVLAVGDKILGGAAQHLTSAALLHHGVISRTVDRGAIDRLLDRREPSPTAVLTSLEELGITEPSVELGRVLSVALAVELARPVSG